MKELKTEIKIGASKEVIWKNLMDFDSYPEWNPFIISLTGRAHLRERLKVYLKNPQDKPMQFQPKVTMFRKNERFAWLGSLFMVGVFDGHHIFEIKELSSGECLFTQREEFSGLLVTLFWKKLNSATREGFEAMNLALKQRCESDYIS